MMLNSNHTWTSEEVQSFASVMQEKAGYMDDLINDLTYTYQLKNNNILLEMEQVDLPKYITDYLELNNLEGIHLPATVESVYVPIDPKRFIQVLDNIIGNAIRYNPENTPIHINISLDRHLALLEIRDEGTGIPPETIENLFH